MKVVIVITGMSFGGAERVTAYLSNYLVSQGIDVSILSLNKTEPAYPLAPAVHYEFLDASHFKNALVRDIFLMKSLRKRIRHIHPDIILGMMSYSGTLAAISCIGTKYPIILSERNDPNTSTAFTSFEKQVIKYAFRHLAESAVFQTLSAKEYYYGKLDRGWIIPNPLYLEDIPTCSFDKSYAGRIISAGRLSKQKNYPNLIKAFGIVKKTHQECSLTIYGEGPERQDLEELVRSLGLENAVLLPGIEIEIFKQLDRADLFVLPSQYEGMPNALIEAMAMGLPVITTDYSGGRGTIVKHGTTGLIVPRNDEEALAQAMLYLLDNREEAMRMGREALKIRNQLDSNRVCSLWMEAIQTIARNT